VDHWVAFVKRRFFETGVVDTEQGRNKVLASTDLRSDQTFERINSDATRFAKAYSCMSHEVSVYYLSFDDPLKDFQCALSALGEELS